MDQYPKPNPEIRIDRFFTTDPKRVNTASGNSKQLKYLHQLFDNTACLLRPFLNPVHGLNDRFYPIYRGRKSQYKQDLYNCSCLQGQNGYTTSPERLARLYFSRSQFNKTFTSVIYKCSHCFRVRKQSLHL